LIQPKADYFFWRSSTPAKFLIPNANFHLTGHKIAGFFYAEAMKFELYFPLIRRLCQLDRTELAKSFRNNCI